MNKKAKIKMIAETWLPTQYGKFRLYLYNEKPGKKEHAVLVLGAIKGKNKPIPTRIHSACLTGDVFGSLRCDCRAQLHKAFKIIKKTGLGVIIYLDQEGRGIGLTNKIKTYVLQDHGLDTAEANKKIGFKVDERNFAAAVAILKDLGVKYIQLMTNNPQKIVAVERSGIKVKRTAFWIGDNAFNHHYLLTKKNKMGHLSV